MTSRRSVHSTASAPWKESSRSRAADSTVDDEVTQQSDVDVLSGSTRSWTRAGRGGVQEYTSIIHISSIFVARRPVYVRLALWFLHHPAWMESHTGGSRLTPTVHPCPVQLGRLWVAYVSYEPNEPQEHAQPVHGSGARVQDHDPGTSQPETQTPRQSAAHQSARFSRDAGECHVGHNLW